MMKFSQVSNYLENWSVDMNVQFQISMVFPLVMQTYTATRYHSVQTQHFVHLSPETRINPAIFFLIAGAHS